MVVLSHSKNTGTSSLGAVKTNTQVCCFGPHMAASFLHSTGTLPPSEAIGSHCAGEMPNRAETGYISTIPVLSPRSSCPYRWWACEVSIPLWSSTGDEGLLNHCRAITLPSWLLPPTPTSYLYIDHFLISSCSSAVFCAQISRNVKDDI